MAFSGAWNAPRTENRKDIYPGHHVKAIARLRAGAVNARRPRGRAVEAAAESIDRAEHSATLRIVMAGVGSPSNRREFHSEATARLRPDP